MRLQARPGKKNYRAIFDVDGKRYCRSTGIPHAHEDPVEKQKYYEKAMVRGYMMQREMRAAAVKAGMTIREYLEACIRALRGKRGHTLRLFLDAIGERGNDPLTGLSREHQRCYMLMRGEELGYSTLMDELNCLWEVIQHAVDKGVLQYNPIETSDIDSWFLRDGLSDLQLKAVLLATENVEWRTAIYLGYYTGATLAQVIVLEWSALNQGEAGQYNLLLPDHKRTKGRLVQVHPELIAHLATLRRVNSYICPALSKLEVCTADNRFSEIVAAAKLPDTVTFGSLKRTHAAVIGIPFKKIDSAPASTALTLPGLNIPILPCQLAAAPPSGENSNSLTT